MTISAKIIEDSVSPAGVRLTTMQLVYPRFIHAEFMTHRVFSRNASSSRAIPVAKMIEQVRNDPAMPIHWGANQPGMQASVELVGGPLHMAKERWVAAANDAARLVEVMLEETNLHKQVLNRLLEPFQHIHVVVTATAWDNFFQLRAHPDAQPEIHALALCMRDAMSGSTPVLRQMNEWHLPYVLQEERDNWDGENLAKVSAARCARVSYLKHDGTASNIDEDLALYSKLIEMKPAHASPVEHQAMPDCQTVPGPQSHLHGNFKGWLQFRKILSL